MHSLCIDNFLGVQAEVPKTISVIPTSDPSKKKRVVIEIKAKPIPEDLAREASEGSDIAETGPMWWHGYFMQAGGAGGSDEYSAFKTTKVKDFYRLSTQHFVKYEALSCMMWWPWDQHWRNVRITPSQFYWISNFSMKATANLCCEVQSIKMFILKSVFSGAFSASAQNHLALLSFDLFLLLAQLLQIENRLHSHDARLLEEWV